MITTIIIIATVFISALAFNRGDIYDKFSFHPFSIATQRHYERFITYALVHNDWLHLIFNMLALYMLGQSLEQVIFKYYFGEKSVILYLLLYTSGAIVSALPAFFKNRDNSYYVMSGASGAINAVIFSSIFLYPIGSIGLFFIPLPKIVFAPLYLIYCQYAAKNQQHSSIAHDAHLWGAVWGLLFTFLIYPSAPANFIELLPQALSFKH